MGKFEKQNRPGTVHSGQKGSPKKGAFASPRKKSNGRIILPVIIGVLVVAIGVCAGLICMRYSGKKSVEPQGEMIRENTYIAGVNVGGLEKQAFPRKQAVKRCWKSRLHWNCLCSSIPR